MDTKIEKKKSLRDKNLEEIFQRINDILMDRFPLIVRRIEYERFKKGNNELPSTFIESVFSQPAGTVDPVVARVKVKKINSLGTDNLN